MPQERNAFLNRIINSIEATKMLKGCEILAITSWGYADSIPIKTKPKKLLWSAVPISCREETEILYLTNNDLAHVRECLIKNEIISRLGGSITIASKDWESHWKDYDDALSQGPQYRSVVVIIERTGDCPL
jgi:hypothetical protein